MEKRKCYVLGCRTVGCKLYRFPSLEERAEKWRKFCHNPVMEKHPFKKLHNSFQICVKHFAMDAFTYPSSGKLLRSAVPTLLPPRVSPPKLAADIDVSSSCTPQMSIASDDGVSTPPEPSSVTEHHPSTSFVGSVSLVSSPSHDIEPIPSTSFEPSECLQHSTPHRIPPYNLQETPKRIRTSLLHRIGMTRLEHATPRKKLLFEELRKKNKEIGRLRRATRQNKSNISSISDLTKSQFMRLLENEISPSSLLLAKTILKQGQKKPTGRRSTNEEKSMALALFKKGPKTYRLLKRLIPLPAKSTLVTLLKSIPLKTGLNMDIITHLTSVVEKFDNKNDKFCALLFDEMSIRPHLVYNDVQDEICGYVDQGSQGRSRLVARQALVFMIRGLRRKWKQPLSFYLSHGSTPASTLICLIKEMLTALNGMGLKVIATVCDMGASNVKALHLLGASFDHPFFEFDGKKVITIYDPPHLLKSFRNLFMKHNIRVPVTVLGEQTPLVAKWEHLRTLAEDDASVTYLPLRIFNLTEKHLAPSSYEKMRVDLATKIFSERVAAGVHMLVGKNVLGLDGLATAEFLMNIDLLFDSMNANDKEGDSRKKMKRAVTHGSPHMQFWVEMADKLKSWQFLRKSVVHPPSQNGWIASIKGMGLLWEILEKEGFTHMNSQNLNQDPLENFFNIVRQNCGGNHFPNAYQFYAAFNTALINNLISNSTPGNTKEDGCSLLSNLHEFYFPEEGTTSASKPPPSFSFKKKHLALADKTVSSALKVTHHFADCFLSEHSCNDCKESILENVSSQEDVYLSFLLEEIGRNEVCPSEKLVSNVRLVLSEVEKQLDMEGWRTNLLPLVRPIVAQNIDPDLLHCSDHQNVFQREFIDFMSLIGIKKFCIEENRKDL